MESNIQQRIELAHKIIAAMREFATAYEAKINIIANNGSMLEYDKWYCIENYWSKELYHLNSEQMQDYLYFEGAKAWQAILKTSL